MIYQIIVGIMLLMLGSAQAQEITSSTPDEWLERIEKDTVALKESWSNDWADIMAGAAIAFDHWDGSDSALAQLKGKRLRQHQAFHADWEKHRDILCAKILANKELNTEEEPYRYIANADILYRYTHRGLRTKEQNKEELSPEESTAIAYWYRVEKAGKEAFIKGYTQQKLTADDMEALRLYSIFVDIRHTGYGILPFHLKLTRSNYGPKGFRGPGEKAPDFALARMESFLKTDAYSDQNPWIPVNIFTPLANKYFLQLIRGYEMQDGKLVAKPYEIRPGHEEGIVHLSDYRGKKPVMLVMMNASDTRCWHAKICAFIGPLAQALGDRMEVLFINTTVHDSRMPTLDFLSSDEDRTHFVHELTMEDRARGAKMFYLDRPSETVDYLLDDMSEHFRNEWMDQGGGGYIVVIDKEGTIVYGDYQLDNPPFWGKDGVQFSYEFLTIRANYLEHFLGLFFANGTLYRNIPAYENPPWRFPKERDVNNQANQGRDELWMNAKIIAINKDNQEIVVERKLPPLSAMKGLQMWDTHYAQITPFDPMTALCLNTLRTWVADTREHPTYTIQYSTDCDLFVNGEAISLDALKAGDQVGIWIDPDKNAAGDPHLTALQIRAYRY